MILAKESYTKNQLDEKKIITFTAKMDRKTLKVYIDSIKTIEKKKNVIVALPNVKSYNISRKLFEEIFPNKDIIFEEDTQLILGVRITDNDMIYEKSLENSLHNILSEVKKNYE